MSKINAVRLINLNYNNNAIRISDETFHFHGDSTLLSLRNGGGKSVLVQMMTAPFVHRKYRNAKDRPFESYFTTNKPSFILVEWVLDQGAGYVLTGMMVRRSQDMDSAEPLEIINFVSEYREPCLWDINHLPVVEKGAKEMVLKNYNACRQMFEGCKKDRSMQFFCYDMTNSAQSRQYFDKIQEYQIHYKEWESIIKKVNLEESGLSKLFSDCRDEKGLVEKWFLDAVENKLNKGKNRMQEFQTILEKYVGQYRDNQSKITRRDTIRNFKEAAVRIREKAEYFRDETIREQKQMQLLARFIVELEKLKGLTEDGLNEVIGRLEEIQQEIARIEYEKLSCEIHELEKQLRKRISNRDMLEYEKDNLQKEADEIEHKLHLLACAKLQGFLTECKQDLDTAREKLRASLEKEEALEPERNLLGGRLLGYYEQELVFTDQKRQNNRKQQSMMEEKIEESQKKAEALEQDIRKESAQQGALKSRVESYDQEENRYNRHYQEELTRNVLGSYEAGLLEILQKKYQKEQEECVRNRRKLKLEEERDQKQKTIIERNLDELRERRTRGGMELQQLNVLHDSYDQELETRKVIIAYLDLGESALFDTDRILQVSGRKLRGLESIRRNLEKEEDELQKEYRRLTQGKTLELPEALEAELKNGGIPVVYGMEWLRKNGYTEEENRRMVKSHPFLPYALILSRKELERLEKKEGQIYTSFPIPIMIRDELEERDEMCNGSILRMPGISFYMLFNENLLNEEKLRCLVMEKEQEIRKKQDAIGIRRKEYQEYFERQEMIRNQNVTKEKYEENDRQRAELTQALEDAERSLLAGQTELEEICQELKRIEKELKKSEKEQEKFSGRKDDFLQLCEAYSRYENNREELERCRHRIAGLGERKELVQNSMNKLREQKKSLEAEENRLELEYRDKDEKKRRYVKYETAAPGDMTKEEAALMEARYEAITGSFSRDIQELEKQEHRAAKRYDDAVQDLELQRLKYHLEDGSWNRVSYDRKEENHQETLLEDRRKKIAYKQNLWMDESKQIAAFEQQMKDHKKRMFEVCGKEEPLPKAEILDQDFDSRKNQLRYQKQETDKKKLVLEIQIRNYDENLTALAEYSEFPLGEPMEWEEDFSSMNSRELRSFKGILVRDYQMKVRDVADAKSRMERVLNEIVREEAFQEDFYKKPLEAMLALSDHAEQVLLQLSTTVQSYDSLMEKLEVDISLVEREKQKIAELLEDYLKEVHRNLGKIDTNSTITIREKSVKMLKIQLPQWEDNENLYQIRIQDMIDEVTLKGLKILEENGNLQEYLGTKVTTKNLYDTVIGIGNVQISLYKIEEQREYPITWAEVAKNSGGEGFLSAFVILSSLLYYMRKDETDIFADRNEGKVLLMDNPFAQTNASHLLKPLMDMAKKTNTQLICLTGLGGESIYNRFDNIYVLNLIAASLRNGMQYLKANHLRGTEPETLIVSQIEVMEQQELIF